MSSTASAPNTLEGYEITAQIQPSTLDQRDPPSASPIRTCEPANSSLPPDPTVNLLMRFAVSIVPLDLQRPGGIFDAVRSMQSLVATSPGKLAAAVREIGFDETLHSVTEAANQLFETFVAGKQPAIAYWATYLQPFLSPRSQRRLCLAHESDSDNWYKFSASRLAGMGVEERDALITEAISERDAASRGWNIERLGDVLELLTVDQRERVVDAAIGFDVEPGDREERLWAKAGALKALAERLELLTPKQRKRVLEATLALPGESRLVASTSDASKSVAYTPNVSAGVAYTFDALLAGLNWGTAMEYMEPEQREWIFDTAMDFNKKTGRFKRLALAPLGSGLGHLKSHHQEIISTALGLPEYDRGFMLGRMGAGLEHLEPEQREQIVAAAIALPEEFRAQALSGLGRGLNSLTREQRMRIVAAANDIHEERWKVTALMGLADGLKHLQEPGLRKQIVESAICIVEEHGRAAVLRRLGTGLKHLEADLRERLVEAVLNTENASRRAEALAGVAASLTASLADRKRPLAPD